MSQACDLQVHAAGLLVSSAAVGPGDGSECAPFASIDTAVSAALAAGGGTITVLGNHTNRFELSGSELPATVVISGRGAALDMEGTFAIQKWGVLSIDGFFIEVANQTKCRFEIKGKLAIMNSTVIGFDEAIKVLNGEVIIENTEIIESRQVVSLSGTHTFLNLSRVTFRNNCGSLISVNDEFEESKVEIVVLDCAFNSNSGQSLILTEVNNPNSAVSADIFGCQFLNNSAGQFRIFGFNLKVNINFCTFTNNRNTTIYIEATGANISVANCDWVKHDGKGVEIVRLVGQLAHINTTVRGQIRETSVHIVNSGDIAQCVFRQSNCTFLDSRLDIADRGGGFLQLTNCAASVSGLAIRSVSVAGAFRNYNAFISIERAVAEIDQLSIEQSQTPQAFLYGAYSVLVITNSRLHDVGSDVNVLLILIKNEVSVVNFSVSKAGSSISTEGSTNGIVVFACYSNTLRMKKIDIDLDFAASIIGQFAGYISAESLTIRNVHLFYSIFVINFLSIDISHISVENCTSPSLLTAQGKFSMYASNVTVEWSHFSRMFTCSLQSHCYFANVTIKQSSCGVLVRAIDSTVEVGRITVKSSRITPIMKGFGGALLLISEALVEDCEMTLAEMYGSRGTIANCQIGNSKSGQTLIFGLQSSITLRRVQMRELRSDTSALADLRDLSTLEIVDSALANLQWKSGIRLIESDLAIQWSSFSSFPFALIAGKSANILLEDSRFEDGGTTETVAVLHGGLLSCEMCERVALLRTTVTSVHSSQGGGVYVSSTKTTITRSVFRQCSAISGGAVAVIESEFHIAESNFTFCSASGSGGAIDISSSVTSSEILNSAFVYNSAKSGGAVNIRKHLPLFRAVSFSWNTAQYGPDIASYTVAARVASSFPTNVSYVSGNPFPQNLAIEMVDHFGQVVSTDNIAQLSFHLSPNVTYGGLAQAVAQNGIINLGVAAFYAAPSSIATVDSSISTYHSSASHSFEFSWKLSFRPCQLGEVRHRDRCELCPTGKFSLSLNDTECQYCPAHAFCPGGSVIDLAKGYWRTSNTSPELLNCPFSDKCLGGVDSECEEGYTGKLCSQCSVGWYRVGSLYCRRCTLGSTVVQFVAYLIQYFSLFFLAFYETEMAQNNARSAAIQIWVDFCQCTSMIPRLRTELPPTIMNLYHSMLYFGSLSASALPISCIFHNEQSPYIKMLTAALVPFAVVAMLVAVLHCRVHCMTKSRIVGLIAMIFYFSGPAVTESFAALLISVRLGRADARWVLENASVEIRSPGHTSKLKYIYGPLFLFYVALPLLTLTIAAITGRLRRFTEALCPLIARGLKRRTFFLQFACFYWKLLFILATMAVTTRSQLLQITISMTMLIALIPSIVAADLYAFKSLMLFSVGSKVVVFCSLLAAGYYMEWSTSSRTLLGIFAPAIFALYLLVFVLLVRILVGENKEVSPESGAFRGAMADLAGSSVAVPEPPQNSMAELSIVGQVVRNESFA